MIKQVFLDTTEKYEPGSQPPEGYLAWMSWAESQHKAGLRQLQCPVCLKWKYPQEKHSDCEVIND